LWQNALWGFASATDRQKLKAFIRRVRAGFYTSDPDYDFEELCNDSLVACEFMTLSKQPSIPLNNTRNRRRKVLAAIKDKCRRAGK